MAWPLRSARAGEHHWGLALEGHEGTGSIDREYAYWIYDFGFTIFKDPMPPIANTDWHLGILW